MHSAPPGSGVGLLVRRLRLRGRPVLHVETLVLACAVWLLLVGNQPFWRGALEGRNLSEPGTWGFALALMTALTAFYLAVTAPLASRHTVKPLLGILLVVTAFASYFMERYTIYLDPAMVRNVLATNVKEAGELLNWALLPHLLLHAVLPLSALWWVQVARRPLRRAVLVRAVWVVCATLVCLGSLMAVFMDFASLMRNNRELRHLITPGNVVNSLAVNLLGTARRTATPLTPVGTDAAPGPAWQQRSRPALFVLVIGETARAQNFSLNGYARDTNPELRRRGVVNFPDVTACGTSTEVSLPCMFSHFGRRNYDGDRIATHESVLHVLARAGLNVSWHDNQSGCKGVCKGLPMHQVDPDIQPEGRCEGDVCLDDALLQGLDGFVRDARGNLFLVLHQLGSHGPAYYKRYTPAFRRFTPACENADLRKCTQAEIVNAYDNSLLYTDHILGRLIDFLDKAQATHDTAMLYVSDHGESLGENGLFLHGLPWAIAPDVQKRVPMVAWLSPAFQRSFRVDTACLAGRAARPLSHDNLFHSLLGLMDVSTTAYDATMDVFAPCRGAVGR